jgi:hypothetical protein
MASMNHLAVCKRQNGIAREVTKGRSRKSSNRKRSRIMLMKIEGGRRRGCEGEEIM